MEAEFLPPAATITSTLVWVRFVEMPIEFFSRETLLCMGNLLGKATKVDEATASILQDRFARVYVEIAWNKPLIPCVRIMGRVQHIEYEGLHIISFNCGQYGHRNGNVPNSNLS